MTDPTDDYPTFRRRLRDSEDRLTEARALIRDMRPHLRPPPWDGPGHRRGKAAIARLDRRIDALNLQP